MRRSSTRLTKIAECDTVAQLYFRLSEGTPCYDSGPVLAELETRIASMIKDYDAEDVSRNDPDYELLKDAQAAIGSLRRENKRLRLLVHPSVMPQRLEGSGKKDFLVTGS